MLNRNSNRNYVSIDSLGPKEKEKLKNSVMAINDSMTRTQAERLFVKDAIEKVVDEVGIDPKLARKLAKTYFKANFNEEVDEHKNFEDLYTNLFPPL